MSRKLLSILKILFLSSIILFSPVFAGGRTRVISREVPNNTSPPAIFVYRDGRWRVEVPWNGRRLPETMEVFCEEINENVTLYKVDWYFDGSKVPTYVGEEEERTSIAFNFYAVYEGEYTIPEELADDKDEYDEWEESDEVDEEDDGDDEPENEDDERSSEESKEDDEGVDDEPEDEPENVVDTKPKHVISFIKTEGSWNKWHTDRYMGYEKIELLVEAEEAVEVNIRFSPELENMNYRNARGQHYSYREEFGYEVDFPLSAVKRSDGIWRASYILPIAPSTVDWDGERLREPYRVEYTVKFDDEVKVLERNIDITGNIYELMYVRPIIN